MKRPKRNRPITVESANEWISYYQSCIDLLENHCDILDGDSAEVAAFKLYAKMQNITNTYNQLKKLYPGITCENSTALTEFLLKAHIEDNDLESFVKYLVKTASVHKNHNGWN